MSLEKTPPPLCDFMQWLDTEQSDFDKRCIEGAARDAREGNAPSQEMRGCEVAHDREADRQRKRERDLQAKEAGPDAIRKGEYPAILSRPRVLLVGLYQIISDFITSSARVLGLYR
jgi:hypothetical protein